MDELRLALGIAAELDVGAARLIVRAVRARGDLAVLVLCGEPDLEVVRRRRREAHVARAELDDVVRQLEEAQDVFSRVDHRVELVPARLRLDEFDELDLVELVLANEAARVAASAAGLGAEARRVAAVVLRQLVAVEDLIAVVVRRRHLSRRHEVVVEAFELEHVVGELRQLARARHALLVGDVRCEHLRVAVLVGVQVHHEVDAGALEAGAEAFVEREARARDLGSAVGVEDVELRAEIPVRLRLEVELRRLPPLADLRVLRVVLADWHVLARHVRDVEHDVAELGLDVLELLVEL